MRPNTPKLNKLVKKLKGSDATIYAVPQGLFRDEASYNNL
jgi:hypothetical protein